MPKVFAIVGGDSRQRYLAEGLIRIGNVVCTYAVPELADTCADPASCLSGAKYIILPMPALTADGHIICAEGRELTLAQAAAFIREDAVLYGGKLECAAELLGKMPFAAEDYAAWESLAIANAVPTAEGAIALAMAHTPITLQDSTCLVVGFGRIGKLLALRLKALGADVTVSSRSERDMQFTRALGLTADVTGRYALGLRRYDCIINTVPASVFTRSQLERVAPACPIIELASAPGGVSEELCRDTGRRYIRGAALPGKVAPKTAGELVKDAILADIRRREAG